ncbi:hypothetical protein OAP84_02345 [Candidatus Pelagibacter sp.]|nr:hypothetical protein [Candidatus Pelagibacter sp.]
MKKQTGEKSLSQKFEDENFGDENDNLDSLFNSGKYEEIIKAWKNILKKKWEGTIKDQNLNDLYLINLILYKPENKLMIFLLKINHNNLDEVTKGKVSPKKTSVWFNNFIDEKFGNVKVYKSKKRVELRICPQEFIKNKSFLNFDINNKIDTKNLREIFENKNKKNKYLLKQSKRIKKFFSKLKD